MRKTNNRIRDGYDYRGIIEPSEGFHEGIEFTYRPVLAEDADAVYSQQIKEGNAAYHKLLRETMAEHLIEWSEWDGEKMAEITPEAVGKIYPNELFWSVWNIMTGVSPNKDSVEADTKNSSEG